MLNAFASVKSSKKWCTKCIMYKSLILKHPQVRFRGLGWFVCVNQLINLMGVGGGGSRSPKNFFPSVWFGPPDPSPGSATVKKGWKGGGGEVFIHYCICNIVQITFTSHYSFIISSATLYGINKTAILFHTLHWDFWENNTCTGEVITKNLLEALSNFGIYPHGKRALMRAIVKSFYKYANNPWPFKPQ